VHQRVCRVQPPGPHGQLFFIPAPQVRHRVLVGEQGQAGKVVQGGGGGVGGRGGVGEGVGGAGPCASPGAGGGAGLVPVAVVVVVRAVSRV
jgi:hypothetical protein